MMLIFIDLISSIIDEIPIIKKYFIIIVILIASFIIAYIIKRIMEQVLLRFLPRQLTITIVKILYYIILSLGILIAIGTLGVDLTTLVIAGGFAGIVVGLALQPLLSNLFTGLYLLGEKSVVPGDFVEVDGVMGTVVEMSVMSTRVRTLDGVLLRIPNNRIFDSRLYNYSRYPIRRLEFIASIAYKEDAEKAIEVIRDLVDKHPLVLLEPRPEVFVSNLGSSGVDISVRVWVPSSEWYEVTMDLLWKIKKVLTDAGIEIPFTQIDVWMRTPISLKKIE